MKFVADLHLHSRYSRAVSQHMTLQNMAKWAKYKGISVIASGDFTHPFWFEQLKGELEDAGNGLYKLKPLVVGSESQISNVYVLLSCEIASIYSQGGKGRRIHTLFLFSNLESVAKFNKELLKRGSNLRSDGRPIVGIGSRDLAEIALSCDEKALIVPAHVWTPWFSLYGSFSGFDSIEECFGDMSKYIYGVETGLSSDPAMNWQIADLDDRAILSFSDAHSLEKMGREATVFEGEEISYETIYQAVRGSKIQGQTLTGISRSDLDSVDSNGKVAFTLEFYPEEGKYHFTGHRDCNYSQGPEKFSKDSNICPVCNRPLTVGVMDRVEQLKSKPSKVRSEMKDGVFWSISSNGRPAFVSLVPLVEILAEATGAGANTKRVTDVYMNLVNSIGSEFSVLMKATSADITRLAGSKVTEAIEKVRCGDIVIDPGFDGNFGVVKIWQESHDEIKENDQAESQLNLFA